MSIEKNPAYYGFHAMKKRCLSKASKDYPYYGGRGIKVCDRWLEPYGAGFKNFIADMGEKPGPGYTIDRKDTNGDYTPANCRWATRQQQSENRRRQRNNTSGIIGVSFNGNRWQATGGRRSLYCGPSREKALAARKSYEETIQKV